MQTQNQNQKGIIPLWAIFIVIIAVLVVAAGISYYSTYRITPDDIDYKAENIKIGDCVQCVWGSEDTVVKDRKEYGPPTKSERIASGIVTDIQDGEVSIKLESIGDHRYIKKFFLWIPDLSVMKPPPYLKGDIYKCKKPQIKEVEDGLTLTKIYNTVKKISCDSIGVSAQQ